MIRVHDTLQRRKVDFLPIDPSHVRLYACGPTVYGLIHIGNARPLVAFDVVARHLRARFPKVTYVRNVTDVDDKIIQRAAEAGEEPQALAARFAAEYRKDAEALGCLPPDVEPRVTTHIPEIVALIETLCARGVGYVVDGDVYFAVERFAGYGELSGQPLDQLESGSRVEVDERKQSPLDFALWKSAKPGEPSWPSPWGAGRPGWHIECSAMAERYLGVEFDLHGGGVDLIFPHHENERAQSQGAHGAGTFSRHWLHNGFVNFNDKKIAKSDERMQRLLKRAFTLRVLLDRHGGEAVRFFLLTTQYRHPINFEVLGSPPQDGAAVGPGSGSPPQDGAAVGPGSGSPPQDGAAVGPGSGAERGGEGDELRFPGLEEAERQVEYGYLTMRRLGEALAVGKDPGAGPVLEEAAGWLGELGEALDDDFNTAGALAALQQGLGVANRLLDGKLAAPKDVKRRTLMRLAADLAAASGELGLLCADPATWLSAHRARRAAARKLDVAAIEAAISERAAARAAKDFARSDAVRDQVKLLGVELMDGASGTTWRVAD